jgi:hypothetical protein
VDRYQRQAPLTILVVRLDGAALHKPLDDACKAASRAIEFHWFVASYTCSKFAALRLQPVAAGIGTQRRG